MINNDLQDELQSKVRLSMDKIVDGGYEKTDVFDEFCNSIDDWCKPKGYTAYIKVFWYDDVDPDEMLDEVCDIWNRFDIEAYCNQPSSEYDGTFVVMLYKNIRD